VNSPFAFFRDILSYFDHVLNMLEIEGNLNLVAY